MRIIRMALAVACAVLGCVALAHFAYVAYIALVFGHLDQDLFHRILAEWAVFAIGSFLFAWLAWPRRRVSN